MDEPGQGGLVLEAGREDGCQRWSSGRPGRGRRCRASAGLRARGRRPGRSAVLTSSRAASNRRPDNPHATAQPRSSRPPVTCTLLHQRHRDDVGSRRPVARRQHQSPAASPRPAGPIRAARLQSARRDPSPPRPRPVRAPRLPPVRRDARGARGTLLADRAARGLPVPRLVERDIDTDADWQRQLRVHDPGRRARRAPSWSSPRARPGCGACSPTGSTAIGTPA